jgi:predicted transcriptional regulator
LENNLKTRVAAAAARAGKTTHAFILDALAATVEQAEQEDDFLRLAETRWANLIATGKTVGWDDAKPWLESRGRGETSPKPPPREPRR